MSSVERGDYGRLEWDGQPIIYDLSLKVQHKKVLVSRKSQRSFQRLLGTYLYIYLLGLKICLRFHVRKR